MRIQPSEKDLYNYIFNKDNLSKDVIEYIYKNTDKYDSELALLKNMKVCLNNSLNGDILDRINRKIENYSSSNEYVLDKMEVKISSEYLILAADSQEKKPTPVTETFKDSTSKMLGKVVNTKDSTKIYIFPREESNLVKFDITLFPSQDSFQTTSVDMPLIVSPSQSISKIHVKMDTLDY